MIHAGFSGGIHASKLHADIMLTVQALRHAIFMLTFHAIIHAYFMLTFHA